ncbi:hypothetical protein Ancab_002691 [Ancistrocladus abbreviatus]
MSRFMQQVYMSTTVHERGAEQLGEQLGRYRTSGVDKMIFEVLHSIFLSFIMFNAVFHAICGEGKVSNLDKLQTSP